MTDAPYAVIPIAKAMQEAFGKSGDAGFYQVLARAAALHAAKNQEYRGKNDPLANFRTASPVTKGNLTMAQYAYTLCSKQDDAVDRLLWPENEQDFADRGGVEMLKERLMDGLVYRGIILAIVEHEPCKIKGTSRTTEEKTLDSR